MLPRIESCGRSRLLEFVRSPILERDDPISVGGELSITITQNFISGFLKWVNSDWLWYTFLRATWIYDSETQVDTYNLTSIGLNQAIVYNRFQSAGYLSGLSGYRLVGVNETSRTDTQLVYTYQYHNDASGLNKTQILTILLQGDPVDVRPIVDMFWTACGTAPAPERPPLRTIAPVEFRITQFVNDQGAIQETSRGLVPFVSQSDIDAEIARSLMKPSTGTKGTLNSAAPELVREFLELGQFSPASIQLLWKRHVIHFVERGQSQFGTVLNRGFTADNFRAISCERGFTEEYEPAIPPILSSALLADFPIATLNGDLTHEEQRRISPPNPPHVLLTC